MGDFWHVCNMMTFTYNIHVQLSANTGACPLLWLRRRCGPVDAGPRCDVDAFSSRYAAPLQYMAWRKMFQQLKPGSSLC